MSSEHHLRVVLDTNVWVSGLIAPDGLPGQILVEARKRAFTLVCSWGLAEEIVEVLRRPKLAKYDITDHDITDVVALLGPLLPTVTIDVELRDADDTVVIESAIAGAADVIVTGDDGLLGDADLHEWLAVRDVSLVSPREFLDQLR